MLREKIEGVLILQRGLSYYTKVMEPSLDIPVGRVFLSLHNACDMVVQEFFRATGYAILYLIVSLQCDQIFSLLPHLLHCTNLKEIVINISTPKTGATKTTQNYNKDEPTGKTEFMNCCLQIINELDHQNTRQGKKPLSAQTSIDSLHFLHKIGSMEEDVFIEDENCANPQVMSFESLQSISVYCDSPTWSMKSSNQEWLGILINSSGTQLKKLTISRWSLAQQPRLFCIQPLSWLTKLDIQIPISELMLIDLGKKNYTTLKHVSLDFAQDVNQDTLLMFLALVAPTLVSLQLQSMLNQKLDFRVSYRLPELTTLKLLGWAGMVSLQELTPENTPLLKSLEIKDVSFEKLLIMPDCSPMVNVVSLCTDLLNYSACSIEARAQLMAAIIHAFPCVKALRTAGINDQMMELIIKGWPQLELLIIKVDVGLTDTGLTGIDFTEASQTRPSLGNPPSCTNPEAVHYVQEDRMGPYIGELASMYIVFSHVRKMRI